jgi:hypothetical protein
VRGVDLAWLWMPAGFFGTAILDVELVFVLFLLVYSIQKLPQCMRLDCVLKDNTALGTGTTGFGSQVKEVPSHLLYTGRIVAKGGVWANWRC